MDGKTVCCGFKNSHSLAIASILKGFVRNNDIKEGEMLQTLSRLIRSVLISQK